MKPDELRARLDIPASTLRLWSQDYGEYLSATAAGGNQRKRNYTEQDSQILALIAQMKSENTPTEEIHASLRSLQSTGWVGLPDIPSSPPGTEPVSMIPREAAETKIDVQRSALMREISVLQERIEDLEDELKRERTDKAVVQKELSDLREKYGVLTGQLTERQSTRFWLYMMAGVIAAAVILTVVLLLLARG